MRNILYSLVFSIILGFGGGGVAHAAELLDLSVANNKVTITLNLPDTSPNKVFIVSNPERLVVDVPAVANRPTVKLPSTYRGKLIRDVRFGQFTPDTYRFVFDLTLPIDLLNVSENMQHTKLEIVITPSTGNNSSSDMAKSGSSSEKEIANNDTEKKKKPEKPLIVIDPGHGGVDPGTVGPKGIFEKDIVLEYAKALKEQLMKTGKYRVSLTRETDKFIMLRERVKIARDKKADLFISMHADSAPEASARGLSVYTLSEKASDQEAAALAARENKADVLAGIDLSEEREDVADILISLAQRDTTNRSSQLADLIVYSFDGKIRLLPNTHRFAGFAVLKAPDIPSVLVELGFLSHSHEEKQLRDKTYRTKIVRGLAGAVETYFAQCEEAEDQ